VDPETRALIDRTLILAKNTRTLARNLLQSVAELEKRLDAEPELEAQHERQLTAVR
jgi:hypothetical protein